MRKRISITLLFCLISTIASAQISDDKADEGSVYSSFGIGMPLDYGSSSAEGMGLWGVSHMEPLVPSSANPAHWGNTVYGMATGGLSIDNYDVSNNTNSASHSKVSINEFQFQLPLYKNTLGLSVGFLPYSNTSFETSENGQQIFSRGSTQDTLSFTTVNMGDGGLNRIEAGLGWRINENIAIGYAASLMYLSNDDEFYTAFISDTLSNGQLIADPDYNQVNTTFQTSGSGFGNRFGAQFTVPSIGGENTRLNLGLAVDLPTIIDAEKVQETTFVTQDPEDDDVVEEEIADGEIRTPLGIMAGLTFEPSRRLAITTEGRFQQWSKYKNELRTPPSNVEFTDRLKFGAGIKYYPFVTGSNKFLSKFKYRLGATYDSGHLTINDEDISSVRISAGLGIMSPTPVSGFNSSVDISFYYEIRGTKSQNLVKENIWGAKVSLNLAELFFFRPKLQ